MFYSITGKAYTKTKNGEEDYLFHEIEFSLNEDNKVEIFIHSIDSIYDESSLINIDFSELKKVVNLLENDIKEKSEMKNL
jgi:predicted transcriptional regulator